MENILRIKEQCKKKEVKLVDLAKELGITPVSLSQALKRKTISEDWTVLNQDIIVFWNM